MSKKIKTIFLHKLFFRVSKKNKIITTTIFFLQYFLIFSCAEFKLYIKMSAFFNIEKLDDNNYATWSVQMRSVLIHNEVCSVVSGKIVKTEGEGAAIFEAKDEKALASIMLCVKPAQINSIKKCSTSKQAWDVLKAIHQPKGPARKVYLFRQLLHHKMAEGTSVQDHLHEFCRIVEDLTELEISLQEELLVIMLLSSLPRQFEHFVVSMETRDSLPTFNNLKVKLLEEGARQLENETKGENGPETLMQVRAGTSFHRTKVFRLQIVCIRTKGMASVLIVVAVDITRQNAQKSKRMRVSETTIVNAHVLWLWLQQVAAKCLS